MSKKFCKYFFSVLFFNLTVFSFEASAGLGIYPSRQAAEDQIKSDMSQLCSLDCGSIKVFEKEAYAVFQMKFAGYELREYVTSKGEIFAVTWENGQKHPDLKIILNHYYEEFVDAESARPNIRAQGTMLVETSDLTVSRGGHASGGLSGKAVARDIFKKTQLNISIESIK